MFAEEHGGEDLKTTITWCSARAEALAHTGEVEEALSLARRAMALAEPTDALADKADASMALARVLSAAGLAAESRDATRAARGWYEAKGHVVGVEWAGRTAGVSGRTEAPRPDAPAIGDRPPERHYAEVKRRYDAHDVEGVLELVAEDWVMVEHRAVGWEEQRGHEGAGEVLRSVFSGSPDIRFDIDEVLACDDRVIAMRIAYRGHGGPRGGSEFEFRVGFVTVVEDDRAVSTDQYEYDDDAAMLARYAELGGQPRPVLGNRASERLTAEFAHRYSAHDLEGLLALYHEDFVLTDHRSVGWEGSQGLNALREAFSSGFGISTDAGFRVDEVIASDEYVIAFRGAWGGPAVDGGGYWEVPVGLVSVNDGQVVVSSDVYEPDDTARMIARYAELGGGLSALGDRPPERWWQRYGRVFAARDREALLELFVEEGYEFIDHRQLGWEQGSGRPSAVERTESAWASMAAVHLEVEEVLACDERVIALQFKWQVLANQDQGGGVGAVSLGVITVIEADRLVRWEQYESDDRDGMLARYAELGGHRSVALGDRPPERWYAEYLPRHAARDIERALELYAESFVMVDHRVVGWEEVHGRAELRELYESVFRAAPGIRAEIDEVLACDERVIVTRLTYRGQGKLAGEFEDPAGYVTVVEHGLAVRIDVYDHDDDFTMMRRYHELGGRPPALGDSRPERHMATVTQRLAAGDLDGLMDLYAENLALVDHRSLPWQDTQGREALRGHYQAGVDTLPDLWMDVDEVLACGEQVIAQRYTLRAHAADGGGETALPIGSVNVFEDGLWQTIELYDPDDREGMLERYAELAGQREPMLGDLLSERLTAEFARGYSAHDLEGVLALYHKDFVLTDHRSIGWEGSHGLDAQRQALSSGFEISSDARFEIDEVIASDARVIAYQAAWRGPAADGGGEAELAVGLVSLNDGQLLVSTDMYERDDVAAMVARYAELGGGQAVLGDGPPERFWAEFCRRWASMNVDATTELYSEDWVAIEHRRLGWEEMRGRTAARELVRTTLAACSAFWLEVDQVLACDDRVIALTGTARGTADADGGGSFENRYGYVVIVVAGLMTRLERFEPEDREAILARYAELSAPRPWHRFDELYNERRLDDLSQLYTDDFVMIDRRQMAWEETHGAEALLDLCRSTLAIGTDQRSECVPLLDDGDLGLVRDTFTGQSFEAGPAGPWEIVIDEIFVLRDGLVARIELFDPADEDASRGRYAELLAEGEEVLQLAPEVLVRDRRGFPAVDVRGVDAYQALVGDRQVRVVARDGDLLLAGIADDVPLFVVAKLREGRIGEAIVLRDELRAREWLHALILTRGYEAASLKRDTEGLLASVHPDGRIVDHRPLQFQNASDPDGIRDIYDGLGKLLAQPRAGIEVLDVYPGAMAEVVTWSATDRATGGSVEWQVFHAVRMRDGLTEEIHSYPEAPPALEKMEELSPAGAEFRAARLFIEAFNAHDWGALGALYTEDCVFVDHRPAGWERFLGPGALISKLKSMVELVSERQASGELVRDESGEVFLRQFHTGLWNGAPWEIGLDTTIELRDGRFARVEMFNHDQEELRHERLAELHARGSANVSREHWHAPLAEDMTLFDYRSDGWGTLHGAPGVSAQLGEPLTGEALAGNHEAALVALSGGRFAIAIRGRDQELASIELYDHQQTARDRFGVVESSLGSWRVGIAWLQALNRRDMAAARARLTDDMVVIDHRPVSGFSPELRSGDAYLGTLSSLMELSEDIRWFFADPGEVTDGVGRTEVLLTGHWNAGGGWAEIPVGVVFVLRDDRYERFELYPPEATSEMEARVAELLAAGDAALDL